jgi:hypothetical protein
MADTKEDGPGEATPFWSDEAALLGLLAVDDVGDSPLLAPEEGLFPRCLTSLTERP